jgi:tetratricopeptide (TPR) repeat protein
MSGRNAPNYATLTARFASSRQWDRTLETAREWLSVEPENIDAHKAAGAALVFLDRKPEAEPHMNRVLAARPDMDETHRLLSLIHFKAERFKEADESIQEAISLNPEEALNWYQLARMCYLQGDHKAAKRFADKALELDPRNADITNLVIMSEPWDSSNIGDILARYHKSLELDPTNATIHENVGFCHLYYTGNYKAAEEAFRRSLFFEPSCKSARSNLFILLKKRDRIYRGLIAPRDFLAGDFSFIIPKFREDSDSVLLGLYLLIVPHSVRVMRYIGVALWYIFVWPLVKAYEYLTIGDILSKAGEVGAKCGGFAGYRRWSLLVRLGIFAGLLATFWGGAALFWVKKYAPSAKHPWITLLGLGLSVGFIAYLVYKVRGMIRIIRERRVESHARRRAKLFKTVKTPLTPEEEESARWRAHQLWAD